MSYKNSTTCYIFKENEVNIPKIYLYYTLMFIAAPLTIPNKWDKMKLPLTNE
jgi:hypothetical protein